MKSGVERRVLSFDGGSSLTAKGPAPFETSWRRGLVRTRFSVRSHSDTYIPELKSNLRV